MKETFKDDETSGDCGADTDSKGIDRFKAFKRIRELDLLHGVQESRRISLLCHL